MTVNNQPSLKLLMNSSMVIEPHGQTSIKPLSIKRGLYDGCLRYGVVVGAGVGMHACICMANQPYGVSRNELGTKKQGEKDCSNIKKNEAHKSRKDTSISLSFAWCDEYHWCMLKTNEAFAAKSICGKQHWRKVAYSHAPSGEDSARFLWKELYL